MSSPGPATPVVHVRGLAKRYGRLTVLSGVDLDVDAGEFVVLVGPSGAGKSTVLHLLAALEPADAGEIVIAGHDLHRHARGLSRYRREEIGIIFQLHHLIPRLTARENVEAAMFGTHLSRRHRVDRADELLSRLDLADRADEHPATLSGGERQRVAVARALANRPRVLFADEPTGSLDADSADLVLGMFRELVDGGTTLLAVSHDDRLNRHADRLVRIVDGRSVPGS